MKNKKKLIKRIAAGVFTFAFIFSFGVGEAYYARDVVIHEDVENWVSSFEWGFCDRSIEYTPFCDSYFSSYKYCFYDDSGSPRIYFSNTLPYAMVTVDSNNKGFYYIVELIFPDHSKSCRLYWNNDIGDWKEESTFSNPCLGIIQDLYSDSNASFLTGSQIADLNFDILFESGVTLVNSLSNNDVYNSSLGYLQNVTSKRMNIHNDEDNYQSKYKFTFDTTSSSGVDLTSGDYVVRLYEQTSIYIDNIWQPFDTPKVHIGDFDASSGSLSFNISEAIAKTDAETGEIDGYNFLTIALNNYVRADTYWLQIFNKETGEYGGFVQMKNNPKLPGQFTISTVHGAEDDMSGTNGTDTGGYVDKIIDTNIGTGTNYEDAELNADNNDGLGELDDFENALNDYVSTLGSIPIMISNMFSFMPPWCLDVVGVSFGFLLMLIVYKLIRG